MQKLFEAAVDLPLVMIAANDEFPRTHGPDSESAERTPSETARLERVRNLAQSHPLAAGREQPLPAVALGPVTHIPKCPRKRRGRLPRVCYACVSRESLLQPPV